MKKLLSILAILFVFIISEAQQLGQNVFMTKKPFPEAQDSMNWVLMRRDSDGFIMKMHKDSIGGGGGDYIPLSGNTTANPITGPLYAIGYSQFSIGQYPDGSPGTFVPQSNLTLTPSLTSWTHSDLKLMGGSKQATITLNHGHGEEPATVLINTQSVGEGIAGRGLLGASYYGAAYIDNSFVQKKYVDDAINDLVIPEQVNLTGGTNVTITGTYPNLTINSSGGGGGSSSWGGITGTLSDQTDLQNVLNGKQPLDATLTGIASLTTSNNQMIYSNGADSFALLTTTVGGRALLNATGTANAIPFYSASNTVGAITTTLGGRNLLNNAGTANTFPYYSASNTVTLGSITAFGRSLIGDADASTARTTLGLATVANTGNYNDLTNKPIIPPTPNLSQVLAVGNTATQNITTTGNVEAGGVYTDYIETSGGYIDHDGDILMIYDSEEVNISSNGSLKLNNQTFPSTAGTTGQVLTTNGTNMSWTTPSGGGSYTAGEGIDITSNVVSLDPFTETTLGGVKVWTGSQIEFEALPSYDPETLYYIEDYDSRVTRVELPFKSGGSIVADTGFFLALDVNIPSDFGSYISDALLWDVVWTTSGAGILNKRSLKDECIKTMGISLEYDSANSTLTAYGGCSNSITIPTTAKLILHL